MAKPPTWFADHLSLLSKKNIIIFDDDVLIHKLWNERLSHLVENKASKIHFASNETEFDSNVTKIAPEISESMILCDYDVNLQGKTGLDIVRSYGLTALTTIVTNNFESDTLIRECCNEQIRILPKPCIGTVPLTT